MGESDAGSEEDAKGFEFVIKLFGIPPHAGRMEEHHYF